MQFEPLTDLNGWYYTALPQSSYDNLPLMSLRGGFATKQSQSMSEMEIISQNAFALTHRRNPSVSKTLAALLEQNSIVRLPWTINSLGRSRGAAATGQSSCGQIDRSGTLVNGYHYSLEIMILHTARHQHICGVWKITG